MSDETKAKPLLYKLSIEDDDQGVTRLVLRTNTGVSWNLKGVDAFIGELITWRDRYAAMVNKETDDDNSNQ